MTSENTAVDTSAVGGTPTETVTETVDNFNDRNDRIATKPATPVIATNGTAVDAGDIDGFLVYVRQFTSNMFTPLEVLLQKKPLYVFTKEKRAMIFYGIRSDKYYTFGVQVYQNVDFRHAEK